MLSLSISKYQALTHKSHLPMNRKTNSSVSVDVTRSLQMLGIVKRKICEGRFEKVYTEGQHRTNVEKALRSITVSTRL